MTGPHPRPSWLTHVVQVGTFVVILGIPDGAVGVLWPSMRAAFHLPLDDLGELTIASAILYFAGGLVAQYVRARFGAAQAVLASCGVALVGLAVWSGARWWWLLLAGVAVLGLSRGVIDAVVNAEAALDGGVRRLALLHGSWAVGGTLGPLLVAAVLAWAHDWRLAVVVVAVIVVPLGLLALADRRGARSRVPPATVASPSVPPAPTNSSTGSGREPSAGMPDPTAGRSGRERRRPVRARTALGLTVAAFAACTAAESGPIAWGYTYLIYDRHLSRTLAAVAIASFWAALVAGRFALAVVGGRLAGTAILEASCLLMMAGTALLWLLPGSLAVVGLPLAGLGIAAVFPILVALMPARVGEAATGRAVGVSIAGASLAGPVAVAVLGVLATHLGVGVLGACLFAGAVGLYAMNRVLTLATSAGTTWTVAT
jgi:fucose permease